MRSGPGGGWEHDATLSRALNTGRSVVPKPAVLAFQGREAAYPHAQLSA